MRVEWAAACRSIEQTDTGTNLFGIGVDTSPATGFPVDVTLQMAACLVVSYQEALAGQDATLVPRILDPGLEEIRRVEWRVPIEMERPEMFYEGWEGRCVQDVPIAFTATRPGTYSIELRLGEGPVLSVIHRLTETGAC